MRGALNLHGSLLPKYRGRAPVHWAILQGETVTGASLHYMLEKARRRRVGRPAVSVPIQENDTALDVSVKVAEAAEQVLHRSLPKLIAGTADARSRLGPDDGAPTLDGAGLKTGASIGSNRARAIHDLVRAVAPPFPGAFTVVNGLPTRSLGDTRG